jgi:hypothetical protein
LLFQVAQISRDILCERDVTDTGLEVTPGVVEIQSRLLQCLLPAAMIAAIGTAMPLVAR